MYDRECEAQSLSRGCDVNILGRLSEAQVARKLRTQAVGSGATPETNAIEIVAAVLRFVVFDAELNARTVESHLPVCFGAVEIALKVSYAGKILVGEIAGLIEESIAKMLTASLNYVAKNGFGVTTLIKMDVCKTSESFLVTIWPVNNSDSWTNDFTSRSASMYFLLILKNPHCAR